jgi:protein-S-isoprenylcysteine O-methyltransferase Ste14
MAHLASQLRRMRNEEQILRDAVTQYAAYVARTPRLIAGAY